jgi:hypothetical protein
MSWPYACAVCGSRDIQAAADEVFCLVCGRLTDKNGVPVPLSEQFTSEELKKDEIGGKPVDHFTTAGSIRGGKI